MIVRGRENRLNPNYALAFSNRGVARRRKGDLEGALADCNEAIRLQPDFAVAFYNRSMARRALGDLEAVQRDQEEAVRLGYQGPDIAGRPAWQF